MDSISKSKLGGICMILGGILTFIPFLMSILVGGLPEDGINVFRYFGLQIASGANISIA